MYDVFQTFIQRVEMVTCLPWQLNETASLWAAALALTATVTPPR